jgi:uncharacterized protein (TIGR02300 family)
MSRPELGTKRHCATCDARFFDLRHDPIHCPKCDAVFALPLPPRQPRLFRAVAPLEAELVAPILAGSPEDVPEADDDDLALAPVEDEDEDEIPADDHPEI